MRVGSPQPPHTPRQENQVIQSKKERNEAKKKNARNHTWGQRVQSKEKEKEQRVCWASKKAFAVGAYKDEDDKGKKATAYASYVQENNVPRYTHARM